MREGQAVLVSIETLPSQVLMVKGQSARRGNLRKGAVNARLVNGADGHVSMKIIRLKLCCAKIEEYGLFSIHVFHGEVAIGIPPIFF